MKLSVYAHPCRHDICSANWWSGQLSCSVRLNTYSQYWASTVRQKNLMNECRMNCVRLKTNELIEKNSGFAFKIFHTEWIKMVSYMNRCVTLALILEQRISMMSIKCSLILKTSELQLPSRPAHLLCLFKDMCWKCRWRHFECVFFNLLYKSGAPWQCSRSPEGMALESERVLLGPERITLVLKNQIEHRL